MVYKENASDERHAWHVGSMHGTWVLNLNCLPFHLSCTENKLHQTCMSCDSSPPACMLAPTKERTRMDPLNW